MRMIDADAVLEKAASDLSGIESFGAAFVFSIIKHVIDEQPTIEAQPVRHGRWITISVGSDEKGLFVSSFKCGCCGLEYANYHESEFCGRPKYCMECGARMESPESEVK